MAKKLTDDEKSTITVLLQAGKTVKEIAKFADIDRDAVLDTARSLDVVPATKAQQRAKELYGSSADDGLTYQDIAAALQAEGLKNDDGNKVHYLTISTWAANYGWRWGGSTSGEYEPPRPGSAPSRSKYTLRMSKKTAAEVNAKPAITAAAGSAWDELKSDRTRIVQLAIIRGAASVGVTDLAAVKKALFAKHGDEIRTARE